MFQTHDAGGNIFLALDMKSHARPAAAIAMIMILTVEVMAFYRGWDLPLVKNIAWAFDLPIGAVNGRIISHRAYSQDLRSVETVAAEELDATEQRQAAWDKIVEQTVVEDMAAKVGTSLTADDIDTYWQEIARTIDDPSAYTDLIWQRFGLSIEQLKVRVIRPLALRQKLTEYYLLNESNEALDMIQNLYAEITAEPGQFDQLVAEYFQARGLPETIPEILLTQDSIEEQYPYLSGLEVGALSRLIATDEGYRFYKMKNFFAEPVPTWQIQEFYVPAFVFETKFNAALRAADVRVYIPGIAVKNNESYAQSYQP